MLRAARVGTHVYGREQVGAAACLQRSAKASCAMRLEALCGGCMAQVRQHSGHAGYSSVGRASDCRCLQQSDGPWFDFGWPDVFEAFVQSKAFSSSSGVLEGYPRVRARGCVLLMLLMWACEEYIRNCCLRGGRPV